MSKGLIKMRRGLAVAWASANTLLLDGELALDKSNGRLKVGDGTTTWNTLPYMTTKTIPTTGAPSNALGVDGDFAIDTANKVIYGPKAAGAWPGGVSLQGGQGIQGVQGNPGTNGAGVPSGGTGTQYLTKIDATNYNTQWSTLDLSSKFDKQNGVLTGVASPTHTNGKLVYDTDNDSLTFFNSNSQVALQVGQESWLRARNVTGISIPNGSAVYISGANSGLPTIGLAQANAAATSVCVGVTTETIANNTVGIVTTLGAVHQLNTSGFAAGAVLYLSAATAGLMTATRPSAPNFSQRVGTVGVSDVSVGSIYVQPAGTGLGLGAANQLLGMDPGGTVQEYKAATSAGLAMLGAANVAAQTALLNTATTNLSGLMSALDKRVVDNLHYDFVADFGGVGNDSTLNDAAMVTALSTIPVGAVLFFPAGTYRFAAAIDINVDKRITFRGVNRYSSIIKTTSATAHIFTKSVAGWYDMWTDLGFQSSVTKTAGAAINIPQGNNVGMNVYRCWFTGMFHGINATGNQSANLSVWADLDISAITNGGRGIVINGATINVMLHNITINAGAATTSACLEVNQSGAVQVTGCDWIMGTNVVLLNSTGGAGPQAVYITNCFFDQPQASCIRIIGTNTTGRVKLAQTGIATANSGFYAIEVAGTGAGGVGTQTALPAGISILDCDIYHQSGNSTGAGIFINGCQDVNIQSTRIAGYSGAGGSGINAVASAGGQTKLRVNGCIIGPNSNLTINNTDAVKLSGAFGALSVTDNTLVGNTQPLNDTSTVVAGAMKNINNNTPCSEGFSVGATYGATVLTTVDTIVMSMPLAANTLRVGQRFLIGYHGTPAVSTVTTIRVRIGTAGTTADAAVIAIANIAAAAGYSADLIVTITAVGAAANFHAAGVINSAAASLSTAGVAVSPNFNSTVANFITVSIASTTSTTHTVRGGILQSVG